MTSPIPPSNETSCVLPPQHLVLGEALAPIAKVARQALEHRIRPQGQDLTALESHSRRMGLIEDALSRINPWLEGLMPEVILMEGVGPLEVGRSVHRMEQVISELVDGYLDAKASQADVESVETSALILGVFRHHIRDICDWLDDVFATISIPTVALRRRGVEPSRDVVLTVPPNITRPPEIATLDALVRTLQSPPGNVWNHRSGHITCEMTGGRTRHHLRTRFWTRSVRECVRAKNA